MTLRFMEGFDHINDATNVNSWVGKWTTFSNSNLFAAGRFGTGLCVRAATGGLVKTLLPSFDEGVIGFAYQQISSTQAILIIRNSASNTELTISQLSNGTIQVVGGATWTSTWSGINGSWYYFEIKTKIANSPNGYFQVRIDGVEIMNYSAVDTSNQNQQNIGNIYFGNNNTYYDDLYVCDSVDATALQGSPNNDFFGPIRIYTIYPAGSGYYSEFVPSGTSYSANNWQNVDEVEYPNDDTDFNYAPSGIYNDSFTMTALLPDIYQVKAIQANVRAKKDDIGLRQIKSTVRASGVDYTASGYPVTDTWTYYSTIYGKNPHTGATWEAGDFTVVEFGYESGEY